ncbi:MAG TPA: hypothetical protein VN376_00955 [Longilinea sp.]|nr:hypothetical protein [Longilinea sp.]
MNTPTDLNGKLYRTRFRTRYLVSAILWAIFGLLMLAVAVIFLVVKRDDFVVPWWAAAISAVVGLLCFVLGYFGPYGDSLDALYVSDRGIEFRGHGFIVRSPWSNVNAIVVITLGQYMMEPDKTQAAEQLRDRLPLLRKTDNAFPETHRECLELRTPVPFEKKAWAKKMVRNRTRYIPLVEFPWWRQGELGADLRKYIPEVFEKEITAQ